MGFVVASDSISDDWAYFNKRTSEMGLDAKGVDAHGIQLTLHAKLYDFGIRSGLTQNRNAIIFPYLDEHGRKLDMYQARMIGEPPYEIAPPRGITPEHYRKLLKAQWPKYLGSKKQFDLYFPIFHTPWAEFETLFITEGIPKAIRACQAGIPCASIQGKDMFVIKQSNNFVAGLEKALSTWSNLKQVIYVADSDADKSEDIRNAAIRLCGLINGRKQSRDFAKFVILPDIPNYDKTGLDDFLNIVGHEEFFEKLGSWIRTYEGGRYFELMDKLNEKLYLVSGTTNFISRNSRQVINAGSAMALVSPDLLNIGTLTIPYSGRTIKNGAATLSNTFVGDPNRNLVDGVDFWPGMEEILPGNRYNIWIDHSPEENDGDIAPFLDLVKLTIPNDIERELLLKVVAHRCHRPQDKAPLMVFLYGGEGTGKSTIAIALANAITSNPDYFHIGGLNLGYSHEDRHVFKEVVVMEEPTRSGMTNSDMESMFKLLGDNETISVNPKGIQGFAIKNRIFLWINTNEHYLPVSGAARRWLMIKSDTEQHLEEAKAVRIWMEQTPNFGGRIRNYIKTKYPVIDVAELQKEASLLESKLEIVEQNRAPMLAEYDEFLNNLPPDLMELGAIPTRIMMNLLPYRDKDAGERQTLTRILSREYPLFKIDSSANSAINIPNGPGRFTTTTFRSTLRNKHKALTKDEAKELFHKWDTHPEKGKF